VTVLFYTVWQGNPKYGPVSRILGLSPEAGAIKIIFNKELCTFSWPLYSMKPSLRNLFIKALTRDRVVPIISASVLLLLYCLISHVELCGMSIAKEPSGSPAGVSTVMQANASVPVIPLYLPVPPVMI
jgi:hypothetical protein